MPFTRWWEEEEELRKLREQGPPVRTPADALDKLAREEEPAPTPTPTPTPPAEELFDWERTPHRPTPPPPRKPQARQLTADERFALSADPLQMMQKVARDQGFEEYAVPFFKAVKDVNADQDFTGMQALVAIAEAHNDDNLRRAVGKYLPFSVPFNSLDDDSKQVVSIVMNPELYGTDQPAKTEKALAEAFGFEDREALQAFRDQYAASDNAKSGDWLSYSRWFRDELAGGWIGKEELLRIAHELPWMVSLALLPAGGAATVVGATTLGAQLVSPTVQEITPGPPIVGKLTSVLPFIAAGGGAIKLTQGAATEWLGIWFASVEPSLIHTAANPDIPLDDRILAGVFAAAPALAFTLPGIRAQFGAKPLPSNIEMTLKAAATERPEIAGATRFTDTKTWRKHGTTPENAATIQRDGFSQKTGVWLAERTEGASKYGDTVLDVRVNRELNILRAETETAWDIVREVDRRNAMEAQAKKSWGMEEGTVEFETTLREVLREQGFDGWEMPNGDLFILDAKLVDVRGGKPPWAISQKEWLDTVDPDAAMSGSFGLNEPPPFALELRPGETPKGRLAAARAAGDWLDSLNTMVQDKLAGKPLGIYQGIANWVASGASKLLTEANFAVQLYKEGLESGRNWSARQAALVRNNIKTAFPKQRVSGKKTAEGQYIELQLRDGNWYRLDEVMEGRHMEKVTELQEAVIADWAAKTEAIHTWAKANGYEAGTWQGSSGFWPRRRIMEQAEAAGLRPAAGRRPGGRGAGAKKREFELQREGEERAGAKYWTDLDALLTDHFNGKVQGVLDAYLKKWTDTFSETLQERLMRQAADVYLAPKEARKRYSKVVRDIKTDLADARAGIQTKIKRILRDQGKAETRLANVRGRIQARKGKRPTPKDEADRTAAREDVARYKQDVKQARSELAQVPRGERYIRDHPAAVAARNEIYAAVNARKLAMEHLYNAGVEVKVGDIPIMSGRVFTWENYLTVKKGLERPDIGQLGRTAIEMSALQRSMRAAFDHSAALLTQFNIAMAHPVAWSETMAQATWTMMRGGKLEEFMLRPEATESMRYGVIQRSNEIARPGGQRSGVIGFVEKTPIVGHGLRASNFAFGATGDIARQMLWRLWRDVWYKRHGEAGLYDLADHINRMTGVVRAGAPIEAAILFAPRFARAMLSMPASMLRGGPKGHAARVFFMRFWMHAIIQTVLWNEIQGQPWNLDARDFGKSERERNGRPEPYSIPMPGGGRVSWAGPWAPYLRAFFHAADGDFKYVAEITAGGKLAPMPGVFKDFATRRQFMGEPTPNPFHDPAGFIRYIAEQFTPFSVSQGLENVEMQMALSDDPREVIRNAAPGLALEFLGVRFTPDFANSLVNERVREIVEEVKNDQLKVSPEARGIIEKYGEEYKTWGELPSDIKRELVQVDDELAKLVEIREHKTLEKDNAYSKLVELSNEQAESIQMYGEWSVAEEDADGNPYTEAQYIKDVHAKVSEVRIRMDELKKVLGVEDDLPDDAPAEAKLLEEYIKTVLEPALDYKDELDGEEYEKLYAEMAERHVDETIRLEDGTEMSMMQRLDRMLAYKEDEVYREYRQDMLALRPYWDFMDTAWAPDFIEAAELEGIQPSATMAYDTPQEFEGFLVADLKRIFLEEGLGEWGKIPVSRARDALTYEEKYGEALAEGDVEMAEAIAVKMADRVMREFYVARAEARDSWLREHPEMLDLLMKWDVSSLGKNPPIDVLDIRAGIEEKKPTRRKKAPLPIWR